jgi:beta-galactosidase/beta-glucuronidase
VVNGRSVFLQGVDWPPLATNFADVPDATYRHRVSLYHELGANTLRVWGGSYLEKEVFYNLLAEGRCPLSRGDGGAGRRACNAP